MAQKTIWQKLFLLGILAMLVVGFSVPLFQLGGNEDASAQQPSPERVCQSDADCYLTCDDKPLAALCSQNLCQQNSCREGSRYALQEQPFSISIRVEAGGKDIVLMERFAQGNFFVRIGEQEGSIEIYTPGLFLPQVLEKFNLGMGGQCLYVGRQPYCDSVEVLVNGEEEPFPQYYTPREGDDVVVKAS